MEKEKEKKENLQIPFNWDHCMSSNFSPGHLKWPPAPWVYHHRYNSALSFIYFICLLSFTSLPYTRVEPSEHSHAPSWRSVLHSWGHRPRTTCTLLEIFYLDICIKIAERVIRGQAAAIPSVAARHPGRSLTLSS